MGKKRRERWGAGRGGRGESEREIHRRGSVVVSARTKEEASTQVGRQAGERKGGLGSARAITIQTWIWKRDNSWRMDGMTSHRLDA